jgi:hypothetical protein
MKSSSTTKPLSSTLQKKLTELEEEAVRRGLQVHYDLLEAAGLKLHGGICKIRGEYHLFIEKRKPLSERIEILQDILEHPFPQDIPENAPGEDAKEDPSGDK